MHGEKDGRALCEEHFEGEAQRKQNDADRLVVGHVEQRVSSSAQRDLRQNARVRHNRHGTSNGGHKTNEQFGVSVDTARLRPRDTLILPAMQCSPAVLAARGTGAEPR